MLHIEVVTLVAAATEVAGIGRQRRKVKASRGTIVKLMRIGEPGRERPIVRVDDHTFVDVSDAVPDVDGDLLESGLEALAEVVGSRIADGAVEHFGGERIGSPIARPHQILCIGLNYADHAAETGQNPPAEPIVFNKAPNTIVGPNDWVYIPRGSSTTDWEVELGVVIGRRARYLADRAAARQVIGGYVLVNDVSERTHQLHRGGQWVKGKSAETFNPCGPWLATPDEVADIGDLGLWLDVNGQRRQTGSTSRMLFDPYFLVHYLSQFMVLEPGDLINTGTPPGVGMGLRPPQYLQAGDHMSLGIDGLGEQHLEVIDAP